MANETAGRLQQTRPMAVEKTMKDKAYSMRALWAMATEPDVYVKAEEFVRTAVADAGGDPEAAIKLAHERTAFDSDVCSQAEFDANIVPRIRRLCATPTNQH